MEGSTGNSKNVPKKSISLGKIIGFPQYGAHTVFLGNQKSKYNLSFFETFWCKNSGLLLYIRFLSQNQFSIFDPFSVLKRPIIDPGDFQATFGNVTHV